ncbi:MAG: HTTM domain-containing protein [Bacteroidota bacterium]
MQEPLDAAPLAFFRIGFGLMMVFAVLRFWLNGWIESLYLEPSFHFSYFGFSWVNVPPAWGTYGLFVLCGLSAFSLALGYRTRWSALSLFLSFTYIELLDKTTYLNHYYFVSIIAFLLIWLPAGRYFSIDATRCGERARQFVPRYTIGALRLMVGIVYCYAGLAKLNSDWLLEAMPLKIWLMPKSELPLIGSWLQLEWVHYAFSWAGTAFDLCIPFLLLWAPSRIWAYLAVVVFHVLTRVLFPIGIFPFVMILAAAVYFPADTQRKWLKRLSHLLAKPQWLTANKLLWRPRRPNLLAIMLSCFFLIQLLFPFRYLLKPGELFWHEDGYRFSWRVMLMEKAGYANFKIVDPDTGQRFYVDNSSFLTPFQEKQMATQTDFIVEYAHYLEQHYQEQGIAQPEIYVESYVALNGRQSQLYVNPDIDLTKVDRTFAPADLLLPFGDTIGGL